MHIKVPSLSCSDPYQGHKLATNSLADQTDSMPSCSHKYTPSLFLLHIILFVMIVDEPRTLCAQQRLVVHQAVAATTAAAGRAAGSVDESIYAK